MTFLVPFMLLGWIPFSILVFYRFEGHQAVLIVVIGGVLFLPTAGYDLPGLPAYTKSTAIAMGLLLGGRLSGKRSVAEFSWMVCDLPMIVWCFCPVATSMSNQLGIYNGLSDSFSNIITWGVPYLAGRVYFTNNKALQDLAWGVILGGLLYVPLCLFEVRMSPQLSNIFYGFFPHSFTQHVRYGAFRPVVFMQHGLMVALWMSLSTIVSFWLWRSRVWSHFHGLPLSILVALLGVTTILCKSSGAILLLLLGCGLFFICRKGVVTWRLQMVLLVVPLYIVVRFTGIVTGEEIISVADVFFNSERVSSLEYRLDAEELFLNKTYERPLFGWGGFGRNRATDELTGNTVKKAIDSLWLITVSSQGLFGLIALFTAMLTGPWLALRLISKGLWEKGRDFYTPVSLSVVVILFMVDNLINSMINPGYIVISGALMSWYCCRRSCKAY